MFKSIVIFPFQDYNWVGGVFVDCFSVIIVRGESRLISLRCEKDFRGTILCERPFGTWDNNERSQVVVSLRSQGSLQQYKVFPA